MGEAIERKALDCLSELIHLYIYITYVCIDIFIYTHKLIVLYIIMLIFFSFISCCRADCFCPATQYLPEKCDADLFYSCHPSFLLTSFVLFPLKGSFWYAFNLDFAIEFCLNECEKRAWSVVGKYCILE